MTLEIGMVGETTYVVTEADTAAVYGSGLAPVLSTPRMIALMENTAYEMVRPHLPEGESTVGVRICVRHLAPTPVGMEVRVRAELVAMEPPRLYFRVTAWDGVEKIGEGEHERFIINWDRFMRRVEGKRG